MHDLNSKIEDGMVCKKSNKEPTGDLFLSLLSLFLSFANPSHLFKEPLPFSLSVPKPRRFEEPEIKIPNTIKARVIPKGVYYGTGEREALAKAKIQNRQKAQVIKEIFQNRGRFGFFKKS